MIIYKVCLVAALIIVGPAIYTAWLIYLFFQLEWAIKHARRYSVCPACHRIIHLTIFQCNVCGQAHELIPVEKEVFYKKCSCGNRLPKLPCYGRDDLVALCPYHQTYCFPIGKHPGKYPEVVIPIIGGTSTGKSAFLAAWTVYAHGQLKSQCGVDITYPFDGGNNYAKNCIEQFREGKVPHKTNVRNTIGIGMDIVSRVKRKGGMRLFLYDVAGEVFDPLGGESEDALTPFGYYDFMDGVIFVIDPFSLPAFRRTLQQEHPQAPLESLLKSHGIGASDKQTDDTCEKFIRGLYDHNLARNEYHYASCAVVITKADAFGLDSLIGKAAAQKRMADNPRLSFTDALDEACSSQLEEWGVGRVLTLLGNHFKEVRYFSVSAFGHNSQPGVPFTPQRIELPILWLLSKHKSKVLVSR